MKVFGLIAINIDGVTNVFLGPTIDSLKRDIGYAFDHLSQNSPKGLSAHGYNQWLVNNRKRLTVYSRVITALSDDFPINLTEMKCIDEPYMTLCDEAKLLDRRTLVFINKEI